MYRKEITEEIVRIFEDVESIMEIQVRKVNGRSTAFSNSHSDNKTSNEKQWKSYKSFHFLHYGGAHQT